MKKMVLGLTLLLLSSLALAACAKTVSQDEYNRVLTELNTSQEQLNTSQEQLNELQGQLATLQAKCPPKNFESLTELETWLASNNISEEHVPTDADHWLRQALRLQKAALEDGYIVSADYDCTGSNCDIYCTTVIDGKMFVWDPSTDVVYEDWTWTTLE